MYSFLRKFDLHANFWAQAQCTGMCVGDLWSEVCDVQNNWREVDV